MGGKGKLAQKEFFLFFIDYFSLDTPPPRDWWKKGWDKARRELLRYILLSFATPSPVFLFLSFSVLTPRALHLHHDPAWSISVLSFSVQKMKEADEERKGCSYCTYLHIHNLSFFFIFGLWHFPGQREMLGVYYYI